MTKLRTSRLRITTLAAVGLLALGFVPGESRAGMQGPEYATDETEMIVRKMVEAHGGHEAWSAGNLQGISRAPARFTAWRNFYLFNLPWMTQDSGARLGEPGRRKLPWIDQPCITVKMTFESGSGDTSNDYYTLFIDPESYRLRAAEYVMTYRSMMQAGTDASPPSIFVWEETASVNGLVVPTHYTVYWSKDQSVAVKDGEVSDWSFGMAFDEALLEMPDDALPDESQPM